MTRAGRLRVAVVFGGRSAEHAISCLSAGSVLAAIDRDRFDVLPIGITAEGRWVLAPDDPSALTGRGRELPAVDPTGTALTLPGDPTAKGLVLLEARAVAEQAVADELGAEELGAVDVVFPLLHGCYGEDGTLQGLLELAGLPYVGSGVFSSSAAMDKHHMKQLLAVAGLSVPPYVVARRDRPVPVEVRELGMPLFVKPARGGSSIGISKVGAMDELDAALADAHRHDPKALVEQFVSGREVECGVLVGPDGQPEASLPAEVRVTGGQDFYDFEAKYLTDATEFDIPPNLEGDVVDEIRATAVRAFDALDCEGLARVDFFVTDAGQVLVNEVNTMPGFTPQSMFPRMWDATGVSYPQLVSRLLDDALRRGSGLR